MTGPGAIPNGQWSGYSSALNELQTNEGQGDRHETPLLLSLLLRTTAVSRDVLNNYPNSL